MRVKWLGLEWKIEKVKCKELVNVMAVKETFAQPHPYWMIDWLYSMYLLFLLHRCWLRHLQPRLKQKTDVKNNDDGGHCCDCEYLFCC